MTDTMTANERVRAAVNGEAVDRVPLCFWHHFKPEGSGERLAELTLEFFQQKFDLDIVKIMPDLPYPEPEAPFREARQVRSLPYLKLDTPAFHEQLLCVQTLRSWLGRDRPLILTLFSPFTYLAQFMGMQRAIDEIRRDPEAMQVGLETIATNLSRLMQAAIEVGANGIFFSCMGATSADLTREEYLRFGKPYDLLALAGAQEGWLNIVHAHTPPDHFNDQLYFDIFADYPVSVISWSDRMSEPTLSEAWSLTDKCLMGGLSERGPLTHGSETEIENEIMGAVTQIRSQRLILANGCSLPDDTPEEWLHVARRLVNNLH